MGLSGCSLVVQAVFHGFSIRGAVGQCPQILKPQGAPSSPGGLEVGVFRVKRPQHANMPRTPDPDVAENSEKSPGGPGGGAFRSMALVAFLSKPCAGFDRLLVLVA